MYGARKCEAFGINQKGLTSYDEGIFATRLSPDQTEVHQDRDAKSRRQAEFVHTSIPDRKTERRSRTCRNPKFSVFDRLKGQRSQGEPEGKWECNGRNDGQGTSNRPSAHELSKLTLIYIRIREFELWL